jgi:hypothetical protein
MVRALLSLSLLTATNAVQVADVHEHMDYKGMKASMLGMAKQIEKNGINDATIQAINGFVKTITDNLIPALNTDKDNAQASLDAAEDAVNKCNTDRQTWHDTTFTTGAADVATAQETHDNCRKQEQVTLDNYTSYCTTLESRVCGTDGNAGWDNCDCPSFVAGDSDAVNDYICCMSDFFEEHRGKYYDELKNCQDATTLHHAQTALCDGQQNDFEAEFCSHETTVQNYCSGYDDCRCMKEKTFEDVKADVEALETIFQTQFVALKHLECYGEQMLKSITDLSGCDAVGDDCEKNYGESCPQIDYPTPDPYTPCTEPHGTVPCQEAWINEFYGWIARDQECTPIHDCDACMDSNAKANTYGQNSGARIQEYAKCASDDA